MPRTQSRSANPNPLTKPIPGQTKPNPKPNPNPSAKLGLKSADADPFSLHFRRQLRNARRLFNCFANFAWLLLMLLLLLSLCCLPPERFPFDFVFWRRHAVFSVELQMGAGRWERWSARGAAIVEFFFRFVHIFVLYLHWFYFLSLISSGNRFQLPGSTFFLSFTPRFLVPRFIFYYLCQSTSDFMGAWAPYFPSPAVGLTFEMVIDAHFK